MRFAVVSALLAGALAVAGCGHRPTVRAHRDVVVTTIFPGASAATVASAVTTPLERYFGQLAHLEDLHSRSVEGLSTIVLAFDDVDLFEAEQHVQAAINAAANLLPRQLPSPPTYVKRGSVIERFAARSSKLRLAQVRDAIDPVLHELSQISGVGLIETCGAPDAQIQVVLRAAKLQAADVTVNDVVSAFRGHELTPVTPTAPPPTTDLGDMIIASGNGAVTRLRDVGDIVHEGSDATCVAMGNGELVEIVVWAQPDAQADDVRRRIAAVLASQHPADIEIASLGELHWLEVELPDRRPSELIAGLPGAERRIAEIRGRHARVGVDAASLATVTSTLARAKITAVDADATVEMTGADVDELRAFAAQIRPTLEPTIALGLDRAPHVEVEVDQDAASRLGVTASERDDAVAALTGIYATSLFTQLTQTPVSVKVTGAFDQIGVRSTTGTIVPLSAIAKQTSRPGSDEHYHAGQFPMVGFRVHAADAPDLTTLDVPATIRVRLVRD